METSIPAFNPMDPLSSNCKRCHVSSLDALSYLHSNSICHRDVKPKNILLSGPRDIQLCDFGSALQLNERNTSLGGLNSYICSRYYRAPELLLGSNAYGLPVDLWSAATVWGELITGSPLFWGESTGDQILEITRVFGIPSLSEVEDMQLNEMEDSMIHVLKMTLQRLEPRSLHSILWPHLQDEGDFNFIQRLLSYSPCRRPTAIETHEFLHQKSTVRVT
ncbi:Uncharacterized protein FKW44_007668 [Caligus rogercresseyi]|uniref:Protein kinase domain-containing protein n=1 Tax=Caligus rogercresseyi TaxID=217165 RepID=A0A7T8QTQ8_CALRO|nr:Uncharacterized protein FKW44_007668 [Caligus rogercresseyi]